MRVTIRGALGGTRLEADGAEIGGRAGRLERRPEARDVANQRRDRQRGRRRARVARELALTPGEETRGRASPSEQRVVQPGGDLDQALHQQTIIIGVGLDGELAPDGLPKLVGGEEVAAVEGRSPWREANVEVGWGRAGHS